MDIAHQSKYTRHTVAPITGVDAEMIVQNLKTFELKQVGSQKWMDHHENIQKLNTAAHHNVQSQSEEFVAAAVETFDMMPTLVHDLLLMEVWREKIYPLLKKDLASKSSIKTYMVMYHEATLCNLLEVLLFNRTLCKASGDCLIDLTEYCHRRVLFLHSRPVDPDLTRDAKELMERTELQVLEDQKTTIEINSAMFCLSILRYLTDHISELHPGVMAQMLDHHDFLVELVPLLEVAPWIHREKGGKTKKFEDGQWQVVPNNMLRRVTKTEAQIWLALNNLICDNECRNKYKWDEHKKNTVLRLRRFFNEVLIDQLPVLTDLQRHVETLAMMTPPEPSNLSRLVIEQLPEIRCAIERGLNAQEVAKYQKEYIFKETEESRRADALKFSQMLDLDMLDEVLEDPKCAKCGAVAAKRCSRCKNEWYCGRECQVKAWKDHKALCDLVHDDRKRQGK